MKRVCVNRLRNEATNMASMISRLDQSDHIQELFDCIYRICLQEQEASGCVTSHQSVIHGSQSVSFGIGKTCPPGANANSQLASNTNAKNAVYDYAGPRAHHHGSENDRNGSQRATINVHTLSNAGSGS